MRNYKIETENRVEFIQNVLKNSNSKGIIFGNSGGKDSALAGILCKMACDNTVGIIMPCQSARNFGSDYDDAIKVAEKFKIETRTVDLTTQKEDFLDSLSDITPLSDMAKANINPRLRMIALYAIAASEGRVVAGTGNRSERHIGYFTKWGDGACDFNPISDLTVREVYEYLKYLDCPLSIIEKEPSAGLFEGQTDEKEIGVTYNSIDDYLLTNRTNEKDREIIDRLHSLSEHKREMPLFYVGQA